MRHHRSVGLVEVKYVTEFLHDEASLETAWLSVHSWIDVEDAA